MLSFPTSTEIVLFHSPVSFGRGIDGMVSLVRLVLQREPLNRGYFLFLSKGRDQIRVLWYDGQGFSLCTKRLSQGRFLNWPAAGSGPESILRCFEAQVVWAGGNFTQAGLGLDWKKLPGALARN